MHSFNCCVCARETGTPRHSSRPFTPTFARALLQVQTTSSTQAWAGAQLSVLLPPWMQRPLTLPSCTPSSARRSCLATATWASSTATRPFSPSCRRLPCTAPTPMYSGTGSLGRRASCQGSWPPLPTSPSGVLTPTAAHSQSCLFNLPRACTLISANSTLHPHSQKVCTLAWGQGCAQEGIHQGGTDCVCVPWRAYSKAEQIVCVCPGGCTPRRNRLYVCAVLNQGSRSPWLHGLFPSSVQ